jgi:sulfur transfer protein SufE
VFGGVMPVHECPEGIWHCVSLVSADNLAFVVFNDERTVEGGVAVRVSGLSDEKYIIVPIAADITRINPTTKIPNQIKRF